MLVHLEQLVTCGVLRRGGPFQESEELHRKREYQRRVLLGRDLNDSLKKAQLQRRGMLGHDLGGIRQLLGCLQFAVGNDDAGSPFSFGLRLPGHRPLHAFWQVRRP